MKQPVSIEDLKGEIAQIRKTSPMLKEDSAFVLWFLQAYLVDSEERGKEALTGSKGDKNIDAVVMDHQNSLVHIVQGKFRESQDHAENRNDMFAFVNLSRLPSFSDAELDTFYSELEPLVKQKLEEAVKYMRTKKYALRLYYVTTGKCSKNLVAEAEDTVRSPEGNADIHIFDHNYILTLYSDYLSDAAPPVHTLTLRVISEGPIQHKGVASRYDSQKGIESWVFTASGTDIAEMYAREGKRLFARNIRGYLGSTDINASMGETIKKEPTNFWYYNNGITIVCDNARLESRSGEEFLRVDGAQVINGQQTTRTLHNHRSHTADVRVLVKVIRIPRASGHDEEYDTLINSIVRATNWQNRISPSDLVSNDSIQIPLEKELRKIGYQYIRKKMTRAEARAHLGGQGYHQIDKWELAQAVAGCLMDPALVRKGKEGLFEDPLYQSIFSSRSVSFYLPKYWLMKEVQRTTRGYPERAYAKWLILRFAWSQLQNDIGSEQKEKRFRLACEHDDQVLDRLDRFLDSVSKAALAFYRQQRGKGAEAADVSTFFQRSKLDVEFQRFWTSRKNAHRKKAMLQVERFRTNLRKLDIG